MTHYAWTRRVRGRRALQKVPTLAELHDISDMLVLPGIAPPDCSSWTLGAAKAAGNGRYIHDRVPANGALLPEPGKRRVPRTLCNRQGRPCDLSPKLLGRTSYGR